MCAIAQGLFGRREEGGWVGGVDGLAGGKVRQKGLLSRVKG